MARLEAVLFLAREPLSSRKLSQYANLADGTEARTLIRLLNRQYDDAGRAFRVEEVAGGFQLLSRAKFARWLRRLEHIPSETRLSSPALETLSVVAYRQPVTRAVVESIRGVACGEILRQLMERDLVRIEGRGEELGRPYLYKTTKHFLQLFGLRNLDELPRAELFRAVFAAASPAAPPNPLNFAAANADTTSSSLPTQPHTLTTDEEDCDVSVTTWPDTRQEELLAAASQIFPAGNAPGSFVRAVDEDIDDEEDDDLDDDDDEEDWDDDEIDDEDLDDDEEFDDDEDLEDEDLDDDEEWEEVEDDEEELDEEDDEEWDDEEDDEDDEDEDWDDED